MIVGELQRWGEFEGGTWGKLTLDTLTLFTSEAPWVDNVPFKSCVPAGFYALERHDGTKYRDTWALVGETVGHRAEAHPDPIRTACVLHSARRPEQLSGCIASSSGLDTTMLQRLQLSDPADGMRELREWFAKLQPDQRVGLVIRPPLLGMSPIGLL